MNRIYFFGPSSREWLICPTCGKDRLRGTLLDVTWYDRERETELSKWYQQVGMQPHVHQWTHLSSWRQYWGGEIECGNSFGFALEPLRTLKEAAQRVDQTTAEDLIREYKATSHDPVKRRALFKRCDEILGAKSESMPLHP
jgi:hypothetical protein